MSKFESSPTEPVTKPRILEGLDIRTLYKLKKYISQTPPDISKKALEVSINSQQELTAEQKAQIINGFTYLKHLSLDSDGPLDTELN